MSGNKTATLEHLRRLKGRIVVVTLIGFGALSGLTVGHRVGTATPTSAIPAVTAPTPVPAGGGFFDQGGGDQGSSGDQGGYSFGDGSAGQPPVTGSGAS